MALSNYQGSYRGLTFGPGTEIQVVSIDGLRSLPDITPTDSPRMRAPGVFSGWDIPQGRTVALTLLVVAQSDLETQLAALEAAFVPLANTTSEMDLLLPGWSSARCLFVRPRKRGLKVDTNYSFGLAQVTADVFAPDPRIYSTPAVTTFVGSGAAVPLNNVGNFESRPTLTVTASATPCTITNAGDGGNQVVLGDSSIGGLVAAGPVSVDVLNRAVTDAAGANRYDLVTSATTWFALQPGTNNISITNGSASFVWRSAWI